MHIGLVGLGRMGSNMRTRIEKHGIKVTGYDKNPEVTDVSSLNELVAALPAPRIVWVMVPAGEITDSVVSELVDLLEKGDLIIDGGNSRFTEDARHAELASKKSIEFMDAGVSGGIWGLKNGYGLMVGGTDKQVKRAMPIFDALRPEGPRTEGFVHAGPVGAGHYAKMVHNGIEYGIMQAFAEGYELMNKREDLIKDLTGTFKAWQRGTVVRSWLLELLVRALEQDPEFEQIEGYVDDSGEGRWTIEEAIDNAVPMPVISASIFARFVSRQGDESPAMKAVAALRHQFGGHAVKKAD
ncbi:MAG: decarboxylating 6-phosphogluconate dehydrogenase [Cryobacterium sp.]|nr:decarboxylating 6-phosphogluconate dehydrogenase [Cryobacterium sp.]MBX3089690.1 decarboxylating 6-phosphogluconate dehydrogenase [Cryobacterium sp.]MBX3115927.1 decarboxylating 6-phosphogluconate dehydrogenase [Cryobacterium sp.]MCC7127344.1 decarboxylating 6-phosphogluconate dehydrogenase [Microbacteriaceae bacterium]MCO5294963.1 decarboxylating 6-phosphogluconate dehydrogenase [Homoserinimonas sp.]